MPFIADILGQAWRFATNFMVVNIFALWSLREGINWAPTLSLPASSNNPPIASSRFELITSSQTPILDSTTSRTSYGGPIFTPGSIVSDAVTTKDVSFPVYQRHRSNESVFDNLISDLRHLLEHISQLYGSSTQHTPYSRLLTVSAVLSMLLIMAWTLWQCTAVGRHIVSLRRRLARQSLASDRCERKLKELNNRNQVLQTQIRATKQNADRLQLNNEAKDRELRQIHKILASRDEELRLYKANPTPSPSGLDQAAKEVNNLKKTLEMTRAALADCQRQKTLIEEKNQKLEDERSWTTASSDEARESDKSDKSNISTKSLQTSRTAVDGVDKNTVALQSQIEDFKRKLKTQEDTYQARLSSSQQLVETHEQTIKTQNAALEKVKSDLAEQIASCGRKLASLTRKDSTIAKLNQQAAAKDSELSRLIDRQEKLETTLQERDKTIQAQHKTIEEHETDVALLKKIQKPYNGKTQSMEEAMHRIYQLELEKDELIKLVDRGLKRPSTRKRFIEERAEFDAKYAGKDKLQAKLLEVQENLEEKDKILKTMTDALIAKNQEDEERKANRVTVGTQTDSAGSSGSRGSTGKLAKSPPQTAPSISPRISPKTSIKTSPELTSKTSVETLPDNSLERSSDLSPKTNRASDDQKNNAIHDAGLAPVPAASDSTPLAQSIYQKRFPDGHQIIVTSGAGGQCGLFGMIETIRAMLPEITPPTIDELNEIEHTQSWADAALITNHQTNFSWFNPDELNMVLSIWGEGNGHKLRVGVVSEGWRMVLRDEVGEDGDYTTVWLNYDHSVRHYSGVKPNRIVQDADLERSKNMQNQPRPENIARSDLAEEQVTRTRQERSKDQKPPPTSEDEPRDGNDQQVQDIIKSVTSESTPAGPASSIPISSPSPPTSVVPAKVPPSEQLRTKVDKRQNVHKQNSTKPQFPGTNPAKAAASAPNPSMWVPPTAATTASVATSVPSTLMWTPQRTGPATKLQPTSKESESLVSETSTKPSKVDKIETSKIGSSISSAPVPLPTKSTSNDLDWIFTSKPSTNLRAKATAKKTSTKDTLSPKQTTPKDDGLYSSKWMFPAKSSPILATKESSSEQVKATVSTKPSAIPDAGVSNSISPKTRLPKPVSSTTGQPDSKKSSGKARSKASK